MIACWREAFTHFALLYEVAARQFWASRACHIGGDALVCRVGQKAGRGAPATSAEASAALTGYSSLREAAQALSFQGTGIRSYPKWVKTPCLDVRYFREQAALWHECSHRLTQIICLLGNLTCSAAAIRGCPEAPIPGALRSRGQRGPACSPRDPSRGHVEQRPDFWHTPPRKEDPSMTERQQETWAGVLLTALMIGMLLGAWLVLRLMVY